MYNNSSLVNSQRSSLLIQNEIRSIDSQMIIQNENVWTSKVTCLLDEIYERLSEKIIDNEKITKETLAEYFFQELDLKLKIQNEMNIALNRPLCDSEDELIKKIIQTMELNLINLWMNQQ